LLGELARDDGFALERYAFVDFIPQKACDAVVPGSVVKDTLASHLPVALVPSRVVAANPR
jgi:hypothetical protein